MKKNYILLLIIFLSLENKAQHTLTAAFNPVVGDIDSRINLDTAGLSLGSSGTSQTWNYTGISTGTNAPYGYTYVPMSSAPNNSLFPTGTIAANVGVGGVYFIYSNTSSKVEWLGAAQPTASNCSTSNPEILYTIPFMYGSIYSFTYASSTTTATITGDGTGTLQLPSGNYLNVLKRTVLYYDSNAYGTFNQIENYYYSALNKFPLLSLGIRKTVSSSTVTIVKWGQINAIVSTAVQESLSGKELKIFPNPVTNGALFLISENGELVERIEITNIFGQVVLHRSSDEMNDSDTKRIDVSVLQKGIYFLTIRNTVGIITKKIIIE